jgi:hypothetical protein
MARPAPRALPRAARTAAILPLIRDTDRARTAQERLSGIVDEMIGIPDTISGASHETLYALSEAAGMVAHVQTLLLADITRAVVLIDRERAAAPPATPSSPSGRRPASSCKPARSSTPR